MIEVLISVLIFVACLALAGAVLVPSFIVAQQAHATARQARHAMMAAEQYRATLTTERAKRKHQPSLTASQGNNGNAQTD